MSDSSIRTPGPDHPITVEPSTARILVRVDGDVIADTTNSLTLREASYPPVHYIPRVDVEMRRLARTTHTTHCPYKGDASYFSIVTEGDERENAVWSYENPNPAVEQIRGHLAFYPDRVDAIEEWPDR